MYKHGISLWLCRMLSTRAFLFGLVATLFPFLDIPVYWPILLGYWLLLFAYTMRRQLRHMLKFRYNPFDTGKVRLKLALLSHACTAALSRCTKLAYDVTNT